jgi:hypothetical protein
MTNPKRTQVTDSKTVDHGAVERRPEEFSANLLARKAQTKEKRVAKGLVTEAALNRSS